MATAPPFPRPWGYDQLIGQNKTNLINASIEAWKNAGREINQTTGLPLHPEEIGLGASILFGLLPFIVGSMVYMRTQKLFPSALVFILTTGVLHYFKLMDPVFLWSIYLTIGTMLALVLAYNLWNKG